MRFDSSPNVQAYYEQIWAFVRQVPHGRVVTYGQIAQALPEPPELAFEETAMHGARLVGNAMAACPEDVPWHRVVNAQGKVSSRADAERQIQLLEAEGLSFVRGQLLLEDCQWLSPGQSEQPKQHSLF